ncbi:MAG: homoserine kinase [Kofleriaceae bacterium]
MGVFTALGDADLAELATVFDLGEVTRWSAIAAGTINTNIRIETARGTYFLRLNEGKAEADVAWEARLITALAAAGVPTPPPITAKDGRPYAECRRKWASAFPWREGHHISADHVTPELARTFGAALGQLHRAGAELPQAWRRGSIYDFDHLATRFDRCARVDDKALTYALAIIREELAVAKAAKAVRAAATHGIIHGDLFRDNVLWASAAATDNAAISAILDFEQASGGSLVYDLAVCINDWCYTIYPRIDLAAALVEGYRSVRELTPTDRAALPIEIRAAATRFTLTRITDVYLARVDNPEKDFRAFLARCEAWRGPALGQLTAVL